MKHCRQFVLCTLLLCLVPFTAFAGAGYLAASGDNQGLTCDIASPGPGELVTVYIFHRFGVPGESANACRFRVQGPAGWNFITFSTANVPVGSATTDLAVVYGSCVSAPFLVGSVLYLVTATPPPCSQFQILPGQPFPDVLAFDCSSTQFNTVGLGAVVNPQPSCCCQCVATEPSTWGRVKELYR